ncbi:MAG: hypothetical protein V4631_16485 [Pseudomonadota bacterium]
MLIKVLITCCALALPLGASAVEPAQDGVTVVRDPLTGKLRAPTAAELRALRSTIVRVPPLDEVRSTKRADGTRAINLGERGMVYSVTTRKSDGTLAGRCVKGHEAAAEAMEKHQEDNHER